MADCWNKVRCVSPDLSFLFVPYRLVKMVSEEDEHSPEVKSKLLLPCFKCLESNCGRVVVRLVSPFCCQVG